MTGRNFFSHIGAADIPVVERDVKLDLEPNIGTTLEQINDVPKDYYEAADIDGANAWQKLWNITIPNMKNYFVLVIVNLITGGLQMFELPMMMTGGGPLEKTLTPVLFIFLQKQNPSLQECEIMAGSILIMIPIALINILVFKVIRSEKTVG